MKKFEKNKNLKYNIVIQSCMSRLPENLRIVFRPTDVQYKRLMKLMALGKYKHLSELIRHIVEIGLDALEKKYRNVEVSDE